MIWWAVAIATGVVFACIMIALTTTGDPDEGSW
jgi:hypothetical protein